MTTEFITKYRRPAKDVAVSNPTKIELSSPGVIVVDGVKYDYEHARDHDLDAWSPSAHLGVIRTYSDWQIVYRPESDANTLPASTTVSYKDDALPAYPVWPDGEDTAQQTVSSTHSTSLAAKTQAEIAAHLAAQVHDLAVAFDDQYHSHWPNASRRATTESWGKRWVGKAWRLVETYKDDTSTPDTSLTFARTAVENAKTEIGIGIRAWYNNHLVDTWDDTETTRILYMTDLSKGSNFGGFSATGLYTGHDQTAWDDLGGAA